MQGGLGEIETIVMGRNNSNGQKQKMIETIKI